MKPLAFNLRDAKKVSGDKHSSTFVLKDGHKLKVAHAPLPALQRKQLERLPIHLADGGIASEDSDIFENNSRAINKRMYGKNSSQDDYPEAMSGDDSERLARGDYLQGTKIPDDDVQSYAEGTDDVEPLDADRDPASINQDRTDSANRLGISRAELDGIDQYPLNAPTGPAGNIAGSNMDSNPILDKIDANATNNQSIKQPMLPPAVKEDPNDPYGSQSALQAQLGALKEGRQGALQQNTIEAASAARAADSERQYQDIQNQQLKSYQQNMIPLQKERETIAHDIANGHIDPDRYINNMSTGTKVVRGLGLLFGGIGSAMSGIPNYAFQNIQNNISNDIKAQALDLGKKESLLNNNLAMTGNLNTATQLTAMQTNSIFASKFRQNAQYATNAAEQSKNLQIAGQFDAKAAEIQHQIALQKALLSSTPNQSSEQAFKNRDMYLRINGQEKQAENLEKHHIPGIPGLATKEVTSKDMEQYQNLANLQKNYNDAQDYMNKVSKLGAGYLTANPGFAARGKSIQDALTVEMGKLAELNRLNPQEHEHFVSRAPDLTGTHFTSVDQNKISQLQKELMDHTNTFKNSLGFPSSAPQSVQDSQSPEAAIAWAKSNPRDPRSVKILNKLGAK